MLLTSFHKVLLFKEKLSFKKFIHKFLWFRKYERDYLVFQDLYFISCKKSNKRVQML